MRFSSFYPNTTGVQGSAPSNIGTIANVGGTPSISSTTSITKDGVVKVYLSGSWDTVTEASSYDIEIDNGIISVVSSPVTSIKNFELEIKASPLTYRIRVKAVNKNGLRSTAWSSYSNSIVAQGDLTGPGVPTSITGVTADFSSIILSWTNPTDSDFAYVEIKHSLTNDVGTSTTIGKISGTTFNHVKRAESTTNYYWLRAVDHSGNVGSYAAVVSVTMPAVFYDTVPANVSGTPTVSYTSSLLLDGTAITTLNGSWTAVSNAKSYVVEITNTTTSTSWLVYTPNTALKNIPVISGNAYNIKAKAINSVEVSSALWSNTSATVTAGGDTTAPGPVTGLNVTGGMANIVFTWTDPVDSDFSHAVIYGGGTSSTFNPAAVVAKWVGPGGSYQYTHNKWGQTLYFWVSTVDNSGNESTPVASAEVPLPIFSPGATGWNSSNDGAGSGLDADLLDGQHGSFYQNASNLNAGTLNDSYLPTVMANKTLTGITSNAAGLKSYSVNTINQGNVNSTYELMRVSRDPLNWSRNTSYEISVYSRYYTGGGKTVWHLTYGYDSDGTLSCVDARGNTKFRVYLGAEVALSANVAYRPVFVDIPNYYEASIEVRFNTAVVTNITDEAQVHFTGTMTIGTGALYSGDTHFVPNGGNIGINTLFPAAKLDVVGGNNDGLQYRTSTRSVGIGMLSGESAVYWGSGTRLNFTSGGAVPLSITTAGSVGIGTTAPGGTLEVNGNGIHISDSVNGRTLIIEPSLSGAVHTFKSDNTAAGYSFQNNTTTLMTIAAGGNVGIGTTTPSDILHLSSASPTLRIQSVGTSQIPRMRIIDDDGDFSWEVGRSSVSGIRLFDNTAALTRLFVNGSGNVGIGSTNPLNKLHVVGGNANTMRIDNEGQQYTSADWYNAGSSKATIYYDNTVAEFVARTTSSAGIGFDTNLTRKMTITAAGSVGIGTSAPGDKLAVAAGNITFEDNYGIWGGSSSKNAGFYTASGGLFFRSGGVDNRLAISSSGVVTIAGSTVWHAGNDGSGSGLDADTVDGVHASRFLQNAFNYINSSAVTNESWWYDSALIGFNLNSTGSTNFPTEFGATYSIKNEISPAGPSASVVARAFDLHKAYGGSLYYRGYSSSSLLPLPWQKFWTDNNDGAGSGLDADLLDGAQGSSYARLDIGNNGNIVLNNGADRFITLSSSTNYNYQLITAGDHFQIREASDAAKVRLHIAYPNGNVGIGTTSPGAKLEVSAGDIGLSNGRAISFRFISGGVEGTLQATLKYDASNDVSLQAGRDLVFATNVLGLGGYPTAGAEKLRITAAGNVGIGTTAPTQKLTVGGGTNDRILLDANGTGGGYYLDSFGVNSGSLTPSTSGFTLSAASIMRFNTAASERMRITAEGNVGIGDIAAYSKLVVSGTAVNAAVTCLSLVNNTPYGVGTGLPTARLTFNHNNTNSANAAGEMAYIDGGNTDEATSTSGYLTIGTRRSNVLTEALRVLSNGDVGIGITAPTAKLHVAGSVNIGVATAGSIINLIRNTVSAANEIRFDSGDPANGLIRRDASNSFGLISRGLLYFGTDHMAGGSVGDFIFQTGSAAFGSGTELMRLTRTGRLGIGTASPSSTLEIASGFIEVANDGGLRSDISGTQRSLIQRTNTSELRIGDIAGWTFTSFYSGTGSETMRLTSAGDVGIGNASPAAKLDVSGNIRISNNASFYWGDATAQITAANGGAMRFLTGNASERMRIAADGNVGIGTTSPGDRLEISGNVFANAFNATGSLSRYNSTGGLAVIGNAGTPWAILQAYSDVSGTGKALALNPTAGNVGIGTTSPGAKLTVNGVTAVGLGSKLSLIGLDIATSATPNYVKIRTTIPSAVGSADYTVNIKGFQYGGAQMCNLTIGWHWYLDTFWNASISSSGSFAPVVRLSNEGGFVCIVLTAPGYWPKLYVESMYSSSNNHNYASGWSWIDENASGSPIVTVAYKSDFGNSFVMNSSGNVGIGIASPSQKLHVSGNIQATALYNSNWNRSLTDHGYIDFGPANAGHGHIYTDRPTFYFNKELLVNGSTVWNAGNDGAGSGLDADLLDGLHGVSFAKTIDAAAWSVSPGNDANVARNLRWTNYGSGHVIFDASQSLSPSGTAVNNTNPAVTWAGTYPTLMGWNGVQTYGVRVEIARYAELHSSGNTPWHAGNDGAGSGLDADLLDGNQASAFALRSSDTIGGVYIAPVNSAQAMQVKGGTANHVYIALFADSAAQSTRSGYLGYGGSGQTGLHIYNERSGGNIELYTTGGGVARVNGSAIWHAGNFDPGTKATINGSATFADVTSSRYYSTDNYTQMVLNPTMDMASWFGASTTTLGGIITDRFAFTPPTTATWSTDGTNFTSITIPTSIFKGMISSQWGGFDIPSNVQKVRFTWSPIGYIFIDNFVAACSTNGNEIRFIFEKSETGATWLPYYTSSWGSTWPGYITHKMTGTPGGSYTHFRVTIERTAANGNNVTIGGLSLMTNYGGSSPLYTWNASKIVDFAATPTVNSSGIWHSGNDGAGSGLDADLLDGYNTATASTASTVAVRDTNGYLQATWYGTTTGMYATNGNGVYFNIGDQTWGAVLSGNSTNTRIQLNSNTGAPRANIYADSSNYHGFLDAAGNWSLQMSDATTAGIPAIRSHGTLGTIHNSVRNNQFDTVRGQMVGVYDPANTQGIWAMGASYVLTAGGSSTNIGNLYGLAWSYNPDYGGAGNNPQSKAGLNHQLLLMQAGTTTFAAGSGIWTNGRIECAGTGGWTMGSYAGKNRIDYDSTKFRLITSGDAYGALETGALTVQGAVSMAAGNVWTEGSLIYSNQWWRSTGSTGWYNSTYATGIYSNQSGQVRTYNGANFHSEGTITAASTISGGTVFVDAADSTSGFRLWGNDETYSIYMRTATGGGRVSGETASDYNVYFSNSGGARGWNFRSGGTNVAGIDGYGDIRARDIIGRYIQGSTVTATSDLRLKSDIQPLTNFSEVIDTTNVYSFIKDGTRQWGVIAQEVLATPAALLVREGSTVFNDGTPILTVDFAGFTYALLAEVKELRKRVAILEKK